GEKGVTIGNYGLNEYEILPDTNTIAITLLRSVGEMGDWGYFPTPEAQCLGKHSLSYSFESITKQTQFASYWRAQEGQVPVITTQTNQHEGTLAAEYSYLTGADDQVALTAFKRRLADNALITRNYNLSNDKTCDLSLSLPNYNAKVTNLLEKDSKQSIP
ncbi:TPA: alpha-mannosidase, partial [Streptococcus pyogenes]|nr:alpha-mannosidase [Streptococcus pyogenes]